MKCPICGKQTLPGAKLCSPCRAALKRAKDDSVWELPPSQRPGEPARESPREAAGSAEWVLGAPRLAGWRTWAIGAVLVGVVVVAGVRITRTPDAAPVSSIASAAPVARPAVADPAPVALQGAIPASTQAAPAAEPSHASAAEPPSAQPPRGTEHPAPPRLKPAKPQVDAAVPPVAPAAEPPAAPAPAVSVPPPQPEPMRPADPWQRMNDALARCRAQDLFGRLGCEYRVRASYCDGHWGETPQCPANTTNDHGQ